MTTSSPEVPDVVSDPRLDLASRIGRLAAVLSADSYPGSDRAALKRHAPGQPPPLAFYRLWLRHMQSDPPNEDAAGAWALLSWGLASCGPEAHRPDKSLGQALAECGYSEARVERLLAASDDDMRLALVAGLVRFVAAKGAAFDWTHLAQLLLTRDASLRERIHVRIASDYYRHLPQTSKE